MNIVIAIDSFKGSLSSVEAGRAAEKGIRKVYPGADIEICPLADGGEGTTEALVNGMGGCFQTVEAADPLGNRRRCKYGILDNGAAVIETAEAAGLCLVPQGLRNPLHTTTFGIGEIIKDAVGQGCRKFLIGLGGSATNDGGIGMLQALGFGFYDADGKAASFGAKGLEKLTLISRENILPELEECEFHIACDVENPLCGPNGSSAVFGPQKGADEAMVRQMDGWLASYAKLAKETVAAADPLYPGAGAAGGLGFAFHSFLNAALEPGIEIVIRETGLLEKIRKADIVVTGEGCLDGQTAMGKAPVGVAELAKRYGKPVIAFAGSIGENAMICNEKGIDAYFSILHNVVSLEDAMDIQKAEKNMEMAAGQVFRLVQKFRQ